MSLTQTGWACIASALINDGAYAPFNNSNAYLGVGDSSNANPSPNTLTDLQSVSNKPRAPMVSPYPQRAANVITFQSNFGTGVANFTWNEDGIFNASSGGQMLTRAQETLITKTSAVSVVFTKTLTIQS
jgi:hypothetical protein